MAISEVSGSIWHLKITENHVCFVFTGAHHFSNLQKSLSVNVCFRAWASFLSKGPWRRVLSCLPRVSSLWFRNERKPDTKKENYCYYYYFLFYFFFMQKATPIARASDGEPLGGFLNKTASLDDSLPRPSTACKRPTSGQGGGVPWLGAPPATVDCSI